MDDGSRSIPLTQGQVAIVDAEDYEYLMQWKWHFSSSAGGYAVRQSKLGESGHPRLILMHREIMRPGPSEDVDHRDRDTVNNRKSNLRICSRSQNNANSVGRPSRRINKFKGVYYYKGAYCSSIRVEGKEKYLGRFSTEDQAAAAYNMAAIAAYGEFAYLNAVNGDFGPYVPGPPGAMPKSGFYGVRKSKGGRWKAVVIIHLKEVCLGTFSTPEEAARAYDSAAIALGKTRLNFPPESPILKPEAQDA